MNIWNNLFRLGHITFKPIKFIDLLTFEWRLQFFMIWPKQNTSTWSKDALEPQEAHDQLAVWKKKLPTIGFSRWCFLTNSSSENFIRDCWSSFLIRRSIWLNESCLKPNTSTRCWPLSLVICGTEYSATVSPEMRKDWKSYFKV